VLITTSYDPSAELQDKAKRTAALWKGTLVPRGKDSLEKLQRKHGESTLLLVTEDEIRYYVDDQPAIFFHPSMAAVRIKRLLDGQPDLLLQASDVREGDTVLDCTAGLASDSIVFSFAVGSRGQVTALESERIPALLIQQGLASYNSNIPGLNEAMRRVQVKHAEHVAYMQSLETRSVDTVYFDPMFRSPIEESSSISPLRQLANMEDITTEAMEQAKRIARKSIVLKEKWNSGEFTRLGFEHVPRSNTKTTYGVIRL
jgi:16S rRNA (guanine1516-N2)-methyltransferase